MEATNLIPSDAQKALARSADAWRKANPETEYLQKIADARKAVNDAQAEQIRMTTASMAIATSGDTAKFLQCAQELASFAVEISKLQRAVTVLENNYARYYAPFNNRALALEKWGHVVDGIVHRFRSGNDADACVGYTCIVQVYGDKDGKYTHCVTKVSRMRDNASDMQDGE